MGGAVIRARARRLNRAGTLNAGVKAALELNDPSFFDERGPRTQFPDWFAAADSHVALHLRLRRVFPSSTDPDPELRSSGKWWDNRRVDAKAGRLTPDRAAYLDERCPGWRKPRLMAFFADADTHIAIFGRLGRRFPSKRDTDPKVASSGAWWENRRNEATAGKLSADRITYLDEHCPGWRDPKLARFLADADTNIAIYLEQGRRFPSAMDPDPELRTCGIWWARARKTDTEGLLPPVRAAYLDQRCPGWRDPKLARFIATADDNITIYIENGRQYPTTTDTDAALRSAGQWWADRRRDSRTGRIPADRAAYLDQHCPGWRDGNGGAGSTR